MQEIIVFTIATAALIYLVIRFLTKKKQSGCDKCGHNDANNSKEL
jgi:FeoB-associated Cys-rich membrane protein